ncbi:MAG: DinB family protein [Acidobacteriota bacterium]
MDLRSYLLASLDRAYDGSSWHGPNLKRALRGLTPQVAFFRPAPERHSAYDLALHAAYWKYVARRRLSGEKRASFPIPGSNFFLAPPRPSAKELATALAVLETEHRALRALVEELPEPAFSARFGRRTGEALISGVAAHDLYHAGQIQLVRKLFPGSGRSSRT